MIGKKPVKKLYKEGFNDIQIAKTLGVSSKEVFDVRRKNDMLTEKEREEILKARRRVLIRGGVALALFAAGGVSYLFRNQIRDSRYERELIETREKTLDQLVKEDPSPYVEKVYYDHDKSLVKTLPLEYAERLIKNPRFQELLNELIRRDRGYYTREQYEEMTREAFRNAHRKVKPTWPATTIPHPVLFGKGFKPEIYFFRKMFERQIRNVDGKFIEIPLELYQKGVYKHECFHAKHLYEGIKLSDEVALNWDTGPFFTNVDDFINESSAHIDTYNHFKDTHRNTPLHFELAVQMAGYMESNMPSLEGLTPFEQKIILTQKERYEKLKPSALRVIGNFKN